jgi:serine/threonine-protein kinase ATR
MVGDWKLVAEILERSSRSAPELAIARVLMALRTRQDDAIAGALQAARVELGAPITSSGTRSYRRCYGSLIHLHILHELEQIHNHGEIHARRPGVNGTSNFTRLKDALGARFDSLQVGYQSREPILSMRRVGLALRYSSFQTLHEFLTETLT